jgi:2-succinyl-5-enolpyruvyl-6-hydroxy-3-cyclohexene-1-carboxylate synthase
MKIKVNRNFLWAEIFVKQLEILGVKHACISPGSRNTPLILAFSSSKKIKNYFIIDERSSAFFALGLAKRMQTPVAVVCTSGTAAVELHPAIVEASQQRVPLIICTADRPPELQNVGANQAINQNDLYHNHIRWFCNPGLPQLSPGKLVAIRNVAINAFKISAFSDRGPVHINFPFRKPLEKNSFTDDFNNKFYPEFQPKEVVLKRSSINNNSKLNQSFSFDEILKSINSSKRGILIAGPESFNEQNKNTVIKLSTTLGYPIFADSLSGLRFGNIDSKNLITNYDALLRSENFLTNFNPELILHFGRTVTSKGLEIFFEKTNAVKYLINEFGDCFDPAKKTKSVFAVDPSLFCCKLLDALPVNKLNRINKNWIENIQEADRVAGLLKNKIISNSNFPNECKVSEIFLNSVESNSSIMLSNSMPIRDFDYFTSLSSTNLNIFFNRGASGIDGITSTALGIASADKKPVILITGDLAFYYDLNSLLIAEQNKIPLVVILVNNSGGGIFEVLPIAKYRNVFEKYFRSKHNLNFGKIVTSFNCRHTAIKSWTHLEAEIRKALKIKQLTVLEIKTDAKLSLKLRNKYWYYVDKHFAINQK